MKSGAGMSRPVRVFLAVAALAAGLWPWLAARELGQASFPGFLVPPVVTDVPDEIPMIESLDINPRAPEAKAHSAALASLPDGRLVAVWYAGSGEGAADVGIFAATRDANRVWSQPRVVFTRDQLVGAMGRHLVSLGNPILLAGSAGRLGLLFVTIGAGKWSGSSLNLTWSADGGETWGKVEKLTTNPVFNLASLPRNPPVDLIGGGWAVPVYEELLGNFPEILWLTPRGAGYASAVSRMAGGLAVMQPSVVAVTDSDAVAFYRDVTKARRMFSARSSDAGRTWGAPEASDLPNPNAGVCVVRLADGRLLCAFNDTTKRIRDNLRLAISTDDGRNWRRIATLAEEDGQEFSYPYMLATEEGGVVMVYSSRRNRIRFVEFNAAWIDAQCEGTLAKELGP